MCGRAAHRKSGVLSWQPSALKGAFVIEVGSSSSRVHHFNDVVAAVLVRRVARTKNYITPEMSG